jgi:hypothetical protein
MGRKLGRTKEGKGERGVAWPDMGCGRGRKREMDQKRERRKREKENPFDFLVTTI